MKPYSVTTGELREQLLDELRTLRSNRSDPTRAKEVVRLANSVNELLRTEITIKKAQVELQKAGVALDLGEVYIADPKTKGPEVVKPQ